MRSIEEINREIAVLSGRLNEVRGRETEVYTRIVGYHRAVDNWNKGKKEEYKERKVFRFDDEKLGEKTMLPKYEEIPVGEIEAAGEEKESTKVITSFKLFTSQYCRNCQPVKEFLRNISIAGEEIDVSTDLGISISRKYDVMSTPTVIFFDKEDNIVLKSFSVDDLKSIFSREKELVC